MKPRTPAGPDPGTPVSFPVSAEDDERKLTEFIADSLKPFVFQFH